MPRNRVFFLILFDMNIDWEEVSSVRRVLFVHKWDKLLDTVNNHRRSYHILTRWSLF